MLLLLRNRDIFNKHRSGWIYTIGEIVFHVILIPKILNDTRTVIL
jgi:hypothetical protein